MNTNRFSSGQGFTYDLNGNLVIDNEGRQFTFNGDNKQTVVKDAANNVIGQYFFDGEGKRIKKITNSETTVFVYSSGKLVAEYSNQVSQTPTVAYTTTDHLGSPRIITDQFGQVKSRRDFMPFGEDIFQNVGASRTASLGYSTSQDDLRQKFTGYQKDSETQLDFAEARMYENRFGRFTAVDPLLASGKSANPQTFNRYIYVGNRPTRITDPKGLDWFFQAINGRTNYRWSSDNKNFDDGDKESVEGWGTVEFVRWDQQYHYEGCANPDCTETRGAVLYKGGGFDWRDSFTHALVNFKNEAVRGTKNDWNFFWSDPFGEKQLGSPGFAFVTAGAGSQFRALGKGISLFATTATAQAQAAPAVQAAPKLLGTARTSLLEAVKNPKLRNYVDYLYRQGAQFGDGSTGAILREELKSGGAPKHLKKAQEGIVGLRRLIKSGTLDEKDLQIAKEVYNNLVNNLTF